MPRMPKSAEPETLDVVSESHSKIIPTTAKRLVGSQIDGETDSIRRTATCPNHTPRKVLKAAMNPTVLISISTLVSPKLYSNLTELMDHVHNRFDVLHRCMLQDTVTQVEDMTGATFRTLQNITDSLFDLRQRPEEQGRIKVSLHGDVMP